MARSLPPTLRAVSAADVASAMPPVDERLALAERAMTGLVADADLPPKIGVHPRPPGAFAHAMPAYLRGPDPDGAGDLLGMKWVAGSPRNRGLGLPAINAVVILNHAGSGLPQAILDGGPITAHRTAAVSGVAIARFGPAGGLGRSVTVGLVGAGVQAHSHLEILGHVLPGCSVQVFDRHPERAERLAEAASTTPGIAGASVSASLEAVAAGANVVITVASFTDPERRQAMRPEWFPNDALVVAVDYATMVPAAVATGAALFIVDDRGQFLANRDAGQFAGYPDPGGTLGEAILQGEPRPAAGRALVTHLGVGLADVVFGDAILRRAVAAGLGTVLPT